MASMWRFRKDAQQWFRHIVDVDGWSIFDMYYFCLVAGLASAQRKELGDRKTTPEFLAPGSGFIGDYKPSQRLITGLLIYAEIKRHGIKLKEKKDVQGKIKELLDPDSAAGLTDHGLDLLNEYASGGYDVIEGERGETPRTAAEFLRWYPEFLAGLLKKKSFLISK